MVKPHGAGGLTDWFPQQIGENESAEYNEQVLLALTNEWCRAVSLSFEERDLVSRSAQKGALEALMKPDGWAVCPFCGKAFSSTSSSSWDGMKHTTCGVRLRLISPNGEQS